MSARPGSILALLAAAWAVYACASASRGAETKCSASSAETACVAPGEAFALDTRVERYVAPGDLRIALIEVAEDSRCPIGAQCIWQGRTRLRFRVDSGASAATIELRSDSATTVVFGHRVTLDSLVPHPRVNEAIDRAQYRAWLHVDRPTR